MPKGVYKRTQFHIRKLRVPHNGYGNYIHKKGFHLSEEHKSKIIETRRKNKSYFLSEESKEKLRKNAKLNPNYGMKGKYHSKKTKIKIGLKSTGRFFSNKTKEKQRISAINYIIKTRGSLSRNIGKHETEILDKLSKTMGIKIIRQYPVRGYFVDGYCKEKNIVFEVDEKPKKSIKQIERENIIKKELNCDILRIKDYYRYKK